VISFNSVKKTLNASLIMAEDDYYRSEHDYTANYLAGIQKMVEKPEEAIAILMAEPVESICYGLALANIALAQLRLDRHEAAICHMDSGSRSQPNRCQMSARFPDDFQTPAYTFQLSVCA